MSQFRLLVVDDDALILQSIKMALPPQWYMLGISSISELSDQKFDAALVDMHLENKNRPDGADVVKVLHERFPTSEIVAMSGDLSRSTMELGLSAGATRFLSKPLNVDGLHITLSKIEALLRLRETAVQPNLQHKTWIGKSQNSLELQRKISNLRGEKAPVLIQGPSGVGKEIVAHLLHRQEEDPKRPFVAINVAAIPENLFESEVFGHVKGAFTGASQEKIGLIEAAAGGDLFLDEIEALPESQQAKLLRFLESGEIRKVGAQNVAHIDCRVIAASNRDLNQMVENGEFREDLLWRLNGHQISIPALKERREDIPLLAQYFTDLEGRHAKTWEQDGFAALQAHSWPGNVRELKRVCEQLCLESPLPIIRAEDVNAVVRPTSTMSVEASRTIDLKRGLSSLIAEYEAQVIKHSLTEVKDIDAAAKLLGISRSGLYKKIKDHGIEM